VVIEQHYLEVFRLIIALTTNSVARLLSATFTVIEFVTFHISNEDSSEMIEWYEDEITVVVEVKLSLQNLTILV
jgi:hypothetical protein